MLERYVRRYDSTTGRPVAPDPGHTDRVVAVAFSPDGKWLASGADDRTVKVWNLATRKVLHTLTGHSADIRTVAFSPDGKLLATGSCDRTVRLHEVPSGRFVRALLGHGDCAERVAFSPDSRTLVSAGRDRFVRLWEVACGYQLDLFDGGDNSMSGAAWSPDGKAIVTSCSSNVKFWEVQTRKVIRTLNQPGGQAAFLPDGRAVVSAGANGAIDLWSFPGGALGAPCLDRPPGSATSRCGPTGGRWRQAAWTDGCGCGTSKESRAKANRFFCCRPSTRSTRLPSLPTAGTWLLPPRTE